MKTLTNIIYPAFALVAFACFALSPHARATCREGCDLNRANTFFGDDPLISNTTGVANTAIGSAALQNNTTGSFNTAVGSGAFCHTAISRQSPICRHTRTRRKSGQ